MKKSIRLTTIQTLKAICAAIANPTKARVMLAAVRFSRRLGMKVCHAPLGFSFWVGLMLCPEIAALGFVRSVSKEADEQIERESLMGI